MTPVPPASTTSVACLMTCYQSHYSGSRTRTSAGFHDLPKNQEDLTMSPIPATSTLLEVAQVFSNAQSVAGAPLRESRTSTTESDPLSTTDHLLEPAKLTRDVGLSVVSTFSERPAACSSVTTLNTGSRTSELVSTTDKVVPSLEKTLAVEGVFHTKIQEDPDEYDKSEPASDDDDMWIPKGGVNHNVAGKPKGTVRPPGSK
ncbi:hypothetical protein BN946_scf184911.g61 [Trametes cinnabarina]|uniref:Uncharacterized protein n=1 Tax=Pycnoporus cinnabarinus TaxID=5643 RepID=A0A060SBH3_PYCCI|nr:hypothetical protein BN946_scf184911.g61 [Trametes cinnabarina]